jgi:hypothetical protein
MLGAILRRGVCCAVMMVACCGVVGAHHDEVLSFGFSAKMFDSVGGMDIGKRISAVLEEVETTMDGDMILREKICRDTEQLDTDLEEDSLDALMLYTVDYLDFSKEIQARYKPLCVLKRHGEVIREFVVLTKSLDKSCKLSSLEGNSLSVDIGSLGKAGVMWLEVLLQEQELPAKETFFSDIHESVDPSQAIYSVFFDKADACLVTKDTWLKLAENNPQITEFLTPVVASPSMLVSMIVVRASLDEKVKGDLLRALTGLDKTYEGRRLLSSFSIEGIEEFNTPYFEGIALLHKKHTLLGVFRAFHTPKINTATLTFGVGDKS